MRPAISPVITTIIILRPAKLPESRFRRKANFTCQCCCFSIQLVSGRSHTPIDENRLFSAALPRRSDGGSADGWLGKKGIYAAHRDGPAAFPPAATGHGPTRLSPQFMDRMTDKN